MPSKIVRTMCPMNCHPTLCGMLAEVSDGKLVGVTGDDENPDSQGFLCVRGQASREIIGNPARLTHPLIRDRRTDDFRRATWDEAMDRIVASMKEADPGSVGIWPGHGVFTTNYGTRISAQLLDRFANFHGCQYWSPAMICWGLGAFGLGLTGMLETNTKEDMGEHCGAHRPLGRESREPAEYRPPSAGGEAPWRLYRHHRRAQDRGRREVGRRAAHPAGHRHRIGAGHDACDLRRAASTTRRSSPRTRSGTIGSPHICRPIRRHGRRRSPALPASASWHWRVDMPRRARRSSCSAEARCTKATTAGRRGARSPACRR